MTFNEFNVNIFKEFNDENSINNILCDFTTVEFDNPVLEIGQNEKDYIMPVITSEENMIKVFLR